ncbi:hypothetical protein AMJ50_00145 [Parcubacteria bacterium DG_74_3]|nr:MAG: hypothetical protein AMJ50_00145 [Parcubacteria bacterium DG_74_3]
MEYSLLSIFVLGLIHGLTPDEHTWPVIFAYVLSQKKWTEGILAAIFFVLPATMVWAFIAGISGFLGSVIWQEGYETHVHTLLGALMIILGLYVLRFLKLPHFRKEHSGEERSETMTLSQISLFGFILGFGPCIPVLMMYAFAAELHSSFLGALSGILFGLGTMLTLSFIAGITGGALNFIEGKSRKNLSKICARISGSILILFGVWLIISIFI